MSHLIPDGHRRSGETMPVWEGGCEYMLLVCLGPGMLRDGSAASHQRSVAKSNRGHLGTARS